jgi:aerobic carbon-monoxide dehydrogenase medium subunit
VKPVDFCLHSPGNVDEATRLLDSYGDEAKVLAGGQSLVPLLNFRLARPAHVVDIGRLPLSSVSVTGDGVVIGATARQRVLPALADTCPLLGAAAPWIGHPPIRTRGTVGGSLAHADPAAELPAVAVALDADFVAVRAGGGVRTIPASAFFTGYLSTALAPSELLTEIRFPAAARGTGAAFTEFARRRGDFALVGCAAQITAPGGVVTRARICLSGVASTPVRCLAAEQLLLRQNVAGAEPQGAGPQGAGPQGAGLRNAGLLEAAAESATAGLSPPDDLHASGDYRRHLAFVLVRRAIARAVAARSG